MTTDAMNDQATPQQMWDQEFAKRGGATDDASAAPVEQNPAPAAGDVTNPKDEQNPDANSAAGDGAQNTGESGDVVDEPKVDPVLAEIREQLTKLADRTRNVEGHIGGLKTQLSTVVEEAKKAATKVDEAPTDKQMSAAVSNPEKWEELKKDFPEWAEATEALLGARLSGIAQPGIDPAKIDEMVNERVQRMKTELREEAIDSHLEEILPDWKQEVKSPKFNEWFGKQPPEIQALASSSEMKDAAKMLRLFTAPPKEDPSAQLREERQQRLKQGAPLPRGGQVPKVKGVEDMTPQELWEHELKLREKQKAERGY